MNILAIGCHPDDVEELCGGTLAKCIARGDRVTICHVANGCMGHAEILPQELRSIRAKEAENASKIIGADIISCDIDDLTLFPPTKEQRDKVIDVVRMVKPDLIITHAPNDYMSDHVAVSQLVFDAVFTASVPHYLTTVNESVQVTPLYYMDTYMGVGTIPTEYVDITDTFEQKAKMLECHETQMKWLREHDGVDYMEIVKTCARYRGLQCGVQYAEGFTQCQAWPKLVPARLLP